jgi:hypothetical protein
MRQVLNDLFGMLSLISLWGALILWAGFAQGMLGS